MTVLTGWAGQLSLGQFAIVGLGAMTTVLARRPRARVRFPRALLSAVIARRDRDDHRHPGAAHAGLFLAVVTLAFAVAAPRGSCPRPSSPDDEDFVFMPRPTVGRGSPRRRRAPTTCVCLVVARPGRRGRGRASAAAASGGRCIAVRDNERAAAALGLSPTRIKLTAFAIAGALAGLAGGLLAGLLVQFEPGRFSATRIALGRRDRGDRRPGIDPRRDPRGAVGRRAPRRFFADSPEVALLTSGAGLLVLLLYFPGGLIQIFYSRPGRALRRVADGSIARTEPIDAAEAASPSTAPSTSRPDAEPAVAGPVGDPVVSDCPVALRRRGPWSTASTSRSAGARSSGSSGRTARASRPS